MFTHGIPLQKTMVVAFFTSLLFLLFWTAAYARSVHVRGYTRKNGTYVQPHYRSAPDGNPYNNWSTKGNINPYTGKQGTKNIPTTYGVPTIYNSYMPDNSTNPSTNYKIDLPSQQINKEQMQQPQREASQPKADMLQREQQLGDMSLPYCRSFSSKILVSTTTGTIKRCECNGKVVLTNLICQCHPCMNKDYSE